MWDSKRHRLNRSKTLRLLNELEGAAGTAMSLYLPPGLPASDVEQALAMPLSSDDVLEQVSGEIMRSRTGAVLFWGTQDKWLVMPPFPVGERLLCSGHDVEPLRAILQRDRVVALIVLRLGAYAVGVFRGEELLASKVGSGLIHSRHKKGGSSQMRFQRHRDKQAELFFDRVCTRVREKVEPHVANLEHVVYGGERHTLGAFRRRCRFLREVDHLALDRRLNVREPKQATLEAAVEEVWTSRVVRWAEV